MKRPSSRPYILQPESIALADMIMNLFIFFFVSFSLLYTFSPERMARLEITLPKASTGQRGTEAVVTVGVTRDGQYSLNARPLSEQELATQLMEKAAGRPDVRVTIQADESSPCRSLVSVFDACRRAGITRTSFAVQPRHKNAPTAP